MDTSPEPQTWHYGIVAKWWAEFLTNVDAPEIDYFRRFVEAGQPALDVGCGTGRLLIPYLTSGLDVDGCDVSNDMIACVESGNSRAFPMRDLEIEVPFDGDPGEVNGLVSGRGYAWSASDGHLTMQVPELGLFEALEIRA